MESIRPHLADLVAWGCCGGFDLHSRAFAVGSENDLELEEASIRGSGCFGCVGGGGGWGRLWGFLPRAHERRSLDVSLHAVSRLDRVSLRPARILSYSLSAFGNRSCWNGAWQGALFPRDSKRFASSLAIFPWCHGLDDSHLRRGSFGTPQSGGTRSRTGRQRPSHRPRPLPTVDPSPRFGNPASRARRPTFFCDPPRPHRLNNHQPHVRAPPRQPPPLPHGGGSSLELPCDRYTRSLWRR